jgi:hypothetical protein
MVQLANKRVMGTKELLKYAFYVMAANFYLMRSSRHSTKATLLDHKAEAYVEKQKEILNKHN